MCWTKVIEGPSFWDADEGTVKKVVESLPAVLFRMAVCIGTVLRFLTLCFLEHKRESIFPSV